MRCVRRLRPPPAGSVDPKRAPRYHRKRADRWCTSRSSTWHRPACTAGDGTQLRSWCRRCVRTSSIAAATSSVPFRRSARCSSGFHNKAHLRQAGHWRRPPHRQWSFRWSWGCSIQSFAHGQPIWFRHHRVWPVAGRLRWTRSSVPPSTWTKHRPDYLWPARSDLSLHNSRCTRGNDIYRSGSSGIRLGSHLPHTQDPLRGIGYGSTSRDTNSEPRWSVHWRRTARPAFPEPEADSSR